MGYVLNKQTALSNRQFSPEEGLVPFGHDEILPHPPVLWLQSANFQQECISAWAVWKWVPMFVQLITGNFSEVGVIAVRSLFCCIPKKWLGDKKKKYMNVMLDSSKTKSLQAQNKRKPYMSSMQASPITQSLFIYKQYIVSYAKHCCLTQKASITHEMVMG